MYNFRLYTILARLHIDNYPLMLPRSWLWKTAGSTHGMDSTNRMKCTIYKNYPNKQINIK